MEYTEAIYPGQVTPLDKSYFDPALPQVSFADLGTSQDARTANQIKEVSKHLNTGLRTFEVAGHSPEVFEAIPKEHLREINRQAKLIGAEATFHAPMVDPTGITQHGWDKISQDAAEKQLWSAIERSHDLDPKGNMNVTMHASTVGLPSPEMRVKGEEMKGKGYESGETKSVLFIDTQGKQLIQKREQEKYFPEEGGKVQIQKFDKEKELKDVNRDAWTGEMHNITYYLDIARDRMGQGGEEIEKLSELPEAKESGKEEFGATQERLQKASSHGLTYLEGSYKKLKDLFDMAWKNASDKEKEKLQIFADKISPLAKDFNAMKDDPKKIAEFGDALGYGVDVFNHLENPTIFVPLREYATEKSAETVANLAMRSYNKFHDTAPIIAVENHPAGQSLLTTGEDLKNVIEMARDKFVKDAVEKKIMSRGAAEKQSEKLIGATWDVGHINMLRKYGYTDEDIIEETKKIAPYVKKVHLSDNFGYEHTELPMGMGNVPIKEIMSQLGKKGFKGKKIVEALSWWQHFSEQGRQHAIIPTLQGFNSPIYGMSNAPYWNQAIDSQGAYQGFPMAYLPEKHFSTYGSGFSSLPEELGGTIPGTQSRFSGAPNA